MYIYLGFTSSTIPFLRAYYLTIHQICFSLKTFIIDLFENLAKHRFPVLFGFSSRELHQMNYITQLHDISIFLSLFYRLR
jgi:hypothetical protein